MPPYSQQAWDQIRAITSRRLVRALERDGWERQKRKGRRGKKGANTLTYRHPSRPLVQNKVVIHPHPKKTMSAGLLKELLDCIGWTEADLVRLGLIKLSSEKP